MYVVVCWFITGRNKRISFVVHLRFSFEEGFHCFSINHFVMEAVTHFTLKREVAVCLLI